MYKIWYFCVKVSRNNNKKFRSFKSKENINKKEVGPYRGFGYLSLISDPIIWQKEPEDNAVNLQILIWQSFERLI